MDKFTPLVSKPGDYCAFNGRASMSYAITRQQAATGLQTVRQLARRGNAKVTRSGPGQYTLTSFHTVILTTRTDGAKHASK